jgi:ABC-2 type transport system ATP-binding protein
MTETVVRTDRLTKRYGERAAVDGVTLTVRRGEVYGFLGPNGAGKTTTLRMVLGLVRPTSGTATVLGRPPGSPDTLRRTGALIEGPGFYPYLSGRANLRVMARYRGLGTRAADRAADGALARVDLADRGDDAFRTYSLGMRQRLGVACALLGRPDLLVLDEPTNGLDPAGVVAMRRLLVDLAAAGQTVLLSSHLLAEVQQVCDRVGVIAGGTLLHEGTVDQLRGGAVLEVHGVPADRTAEVLTAVTGGPVGTGVDSRGNAVLTVPAAGVDVPDLTRNLVAAGVDVHGVAVRERALEDVFLTMTGADR